MVEKIKAKQSMPCDLQVLVRRKNNPNETVYEELKIGISRSFAGVGLDKMDMVVD